MQETQRNFNINYVRTSKFREQGKGGSGSLSLSTTVSNDKKTGFVQSEWAQKTIRNLSQGPVPHSWDRRGKTYPPTQWFMNLPAHENPPGMVKMAKPGPHPRPIKSQSLRLGFSPLRGLKLPWWFQCADKFGNHRYDLYIQDSVYLSLHIFFRFKFHILNCTLW